MHHGRQLWLLLSVVLFVCFNCDTGYADITYSCADGVHEFESHIIVLNTEDNPGEVENVCVCCGYSYIEYLPATGHEYGAWETVEENDETGIRKERRVCLQCHRSEFRETPMKAAWKANRMDYLLSASIGGVWGYGALALWYDGLVFNWYKKGKKKTKEKQKGVKTYDSQQYCRINFAGIQCTGGKNYSKTQ